MSTLLPWFDIRPLEPDINGHHGGWRARLEARARRSAVTQRRYPRRFILFGPRIVPLETFLRSQAMTSHSLQAQLNRVTAELHKAERGIEKRKRSLEQAHEYITVLKARLREVHPEDFPDLHSTALKAG